MKAMKILFEKRAGDRIFTAVGGSTGLCANGVKKYFLIPPTAKWIEVVLSKTSLREGCLVSQGKCGEDIRFLGASQEDTLDVHSDNLINKFLGGSKSRKFYVAINYWEEE